MTILLRTVWREPLYVLNSSRGRKETSGFTLRPTKMPRSSLLPDPFARSSCRAGAALRWSCFALRRRFTLRRSPRIYARPAMMGSQVLSCGSTDSANWRANRRRVGRLVPRSMAALRMRWAANLVHVWRTSGSAAPAGKWPATCRNKRSIGWRPDAE